ncbi:4_t:CDS:1, partial [Cetraspora pellucida]
KNQKLVNFFNASHIWHWELQNWQKKKDIKHFLSTFCETRWYSLAKVCISVSTYEKGFQHCLLLSETDHPKYSEIENATIKSFIQDRYYFADNDALTKVIKPVVDAIGRLESSDSTLADIFKELIYIYQQISLLNIPISDLKNHALTVIDKCTKEFDSDIYFITFFLSPAYKQLAISGKMNEDKIICACLKLARVWDFKKKKDAILPTRELISYKNNDPPFNIPTLKPPRLFWSDFTGNAPLLHHFALKVFSIVPHGAACK